ncbi:hypothetical protein N751_17195 [Legionella pneumophila str. Leg01/11]|nr:hypothetical protein N751_17195 [Legionella pneumophila str. Leg01/11]
MQRLQKITLASAEGQTKALLESVKRAMGTELNIFSAFANSPAALEGYLSLMNALSKGVLNAKLRDQIALVSAGFNGCNYCASAHAYLGEKAGLSKSELSKNLEGHSEDKKTQAALTFAKTLIELRGQINDANIKAVREEGFTDEELVEIVAHVGMNTLTNYFNEAFKTEIDFPLIHAKKLD